MAAKYHDVWNKRGTENHTLKLSAVQLLENETEIGYQKFTERDTETNTGEVTHLGAF